MDNFNFYRCQGIPRRLHAPCHETAAQSVKLRLAGERKRSTAQSLMTEFSRPSLVENPTLFHVGVNPVYPPADRGILSSTHVCSLLPFRNSRFFRFFFIFCRRTSPKCRYFRLSCQKLSRYPVIKISN